MLTSKSLAGMVSIDGWATMVHQAACGECGKGTHVPELATPVCSMAGVEPSVKVTNVVGAASLLRARVAFSQNAELTSEQSHIDPCFEGE